MRTFIKNSYLFLYKIIYKVRGVKMGKKIISLSVDEKTYEEYKKICEKNGWILSKQIENFMINEIKKNGGRDDR